MIRPQIAHPLGIALAVLVFLWGESSAAERPNILWLTSEDHGPQMGCYGDAIARTPNVDALAARGMIYTRVWSCVPVCAPARTAIICGMYPASTGGLHMRSMVPLPAGTTMFSRLLREAGYYSSNNSKEDYNLPKPAGTWDESSAEAHWMRRPEGRPFFAVFNSMKSHESQIRTRPHRQVTDPAAVRVPAYHPDRPEVREDWAQYYDKVSEADADAGARLRELEAAGLAGDTIVFYYADHGSGMPRSKRWPGNSGLHVPLVVYFPPRWRHLAGDDYRPGGRSDRLVEFVDLAPTVLSIAGVEPPDWMQGRAFAGEYEREPRKYLHGARGRMDERLDLVRSVTDGRYVYLRNYLPHLSHGQHVDYQFQTPTTRVWRELFDAGQATAAQSLFWQTPKQAEELYDLKTDPDEVVNLAKSPEHGEILLELRQAAREHAVATRDVCFLPEGEMHQRSQGSTPYDMARDGSAYPLERILETADVASQLDESALPRLTGLLADADSAVRYWAAMGFLMRRAEAVEVGKDALRQALGDASPYVRIAAAEALARYSSDSDVQEALAVLGELAPARKNGVLVSMPALTAIESLGGKAEPLFELIGRMNPQGPSPGSRFDPYVPRLIENIRTMPRDGAPDGY